MYKLGFFKLKNNLFDWLKTCEANEKLFKTTMFCAEDIADDFLFKTTQDKFQVVSAWYLVKEADEIIGGLMTQIYEVFQAGKEAAPILEQV